MPLGIGGELTWAFALTAALVWVVERYAVGRVDRVYASAPYLEHLVLAAYLWEALGFGALGGLLSFWLAWLRLRELGVL